MPRIHDKAANPEEMKAVRLEAYKKTKISVDGQIGLFKLIKAVPMTQEDIAAGLGYKKKESPPDSPTNITMRTTFILQNSNPSFDKYFNEMKKRNQSKGWITQNNGVTIKSRHTKTSETNLNTNESVMRSATKSFGVK
jgi:hypothetical protein